MLDQLIAATIIWLSITFLLPETKKKLGSIIIAVVVLTALYISFNNSVLGRGVGVGDINYTDLFFSVYKHDK